MGFSIDDLRLTIDDWRKNPLQRTGAEDARGATAHARLLPLLRSRRRRGEFTRPSRNARPLLQRGFTLLETALAVIIVGVGVLAIVSAQSAFLKQNVWSTNAGTAAHLANEIRELSLNLARHDPVTGTAFWGPEPNEASLIDYDDLDDFDGNGNGTIFSAALNNGPINGQRQVIPNMPGWAQIVTVVNVQTNDINNVLADGSTNMMRMQVVLTYQGPQDQQAVEMTRVSWVSPK